MRLKSSGAINNLNSSGYSNEAQECSDQIQKITDLSFKWNK